jgi:hypothetical protein
VDDLKPVYKEHLEKLEAFKQQKDWEGATHYFQNLGKNNHHHAIFLAYFLAQKSYILQGDGVNQRLEEFPELKRKTKVISGIVNIPEDLEVVPYEERREILIQLSGSTAPVIKLEENVHFVQNVLDLFLETYESQTEDAKKLKWNFVCNPRVLEKLTIDRSTLPENFNIQPTVSQAENFKKMARSKAVFMAPSLLGTYEAAYFEAPIFMLPEQNGGQPANYKKIRDNGFGNQNNITLCEVVGEDFSGDEKAPLIYEAHDRIFGEFRTDALQRINTFFQKMSDSTVMKKLVTNQKEGYSKLMGGYNGLKIISTDIVQRILAQL